MGQGRARWQPRPFLQTAFQESRPQFSPDGRWIVYTSNETGRNEVYATPFRGPGGKVRAAAIHPQNDGLQVGEVRPLFDVRLGRPAVPGYVGYMFEVTADGQRFLVNAAKGDETVASAISLVINWTAALMK